MESKTTFSILFWALKSRVKNGNAPLYARLTLNGERVEISTAREVPLSIWDAKAQMVMGKSAQAREINNHLAVVRNKILACETKLELREETITAEKLKNEYLGVRPKRIKLSEAFEFKLAQLKAIAKSKGKRKDPTFEKYDDTFNHIKKYLQHQYNVTDKYLEEVDYSFITDFEFYLSVTKSLAKNTAMKYVSQTKSIFRLSFQRGWIKSNPVAAFSCSFDYKEPLRLELHELKTLYEKPLPVKRLEEARDVYVFMCYTGFAYIDTLNLTNDNIFWGIDKLKWIAKDRQKTDGFECVPLLDIPLAIIDKYKSHPQCINAGKLLPVNSNQKFNGYLKEIAAICGINKDLTTHTGRYTFATSVTLENEVPLETVGKMLGHRSIKSTQRYARVTRNKINNNMNALKEKLSNKDNLRIMEDNKSDRLASNG